MNQASNLTVVEVIEVVICAPLGSGLPSSLSQVTWGTGIPLAEQFRVTLFHSWTTVDAAGSATMMMGTVCVCVCVQMKHDNYMYVRQTLLHITQFTLYLFAYKNWRHPVYSTPSQIHTCTYLKPIVTKIKQLLHRSELQVDSHHVHTHEILFLLLRYTH